MKPLRLVRHTVGILLVLATPAFPFECRVCHSKNPAMVRMHQALQGRSCFDCHKVTDRLMGKAPSTGRPELLSRRESEPLCRECHRQ